MFDTYPNLAEFLQVSEVQSGVKLPAFLDHLFAKIDEHIAKKGKVLLLTLTKKSAEEISSFLISRGYKAFYLHSEIGTTDRWEIIKKLRNGTIDILVGINLLREGIDLPEVSLLAILDADKEGFLRSSTSLVQIIGRAARNPDSEVVLYADRWTESIIKALRETYRRRHTQMAHNEAHGITPSKAISNVKDLEVVKTDEQLTQDFSLLTRGKTRRLKRLTKKEKSIMADELKSQLDEAIKNREFEKAAVLRDQIKELTEEEKARPEVEEDED